MIVVNYNNCSTKKLLSMYDVSDVAERKKIKYILFERGLSFDVGKQKLKDCNVQNISNNSRRES